MPIEKGESWGSAGELPPNAPVLSSDAAVSAMVGVEPIVAVEHGDLARTLGVRSPFDRDGSKHLVPIDVLSVELDDGSTHIACAHATLGSVRNSARSVAIMNAAFIGDRNIAPRAHPGDGKADVVTLSLGLGDRVKAWRRMPTGTHLPHPDISVNRRAHGQITLDRPHRVRVDGVAVGRSRSLHYRVVPDAIIIAVS